MMVKLYRIDDQRHQVPTFTAKTFFERKTRYCVCIPVLNEGQRIQRQLERMKPFAHLSDIIIADGGSTDHALEEHLLRSCGVRTLLTKTGPGKLSAQMRMALYYGVHEGYKGFIFIDGNNKDDPSAIPSFIRELDRGFDHIQGSRFIEEGRTSNTPWFRSLLIRLIHAPLISWAAGFRYTDTTNGFRAYSLKLITDERVQPFRDVFSAYELHYYLSIRAARLHLRVKEIPVIREYPKGEVPTKIRGIRSYLVILKTLYNACMQRYNP